MNLDRIAGTIPPVDEQRVEAELMEYVGDAAPTVAAREPWAIPVITATSTPEQAAAAMSVADWAIRMLGTLADQVAQYDAVIAGWQKARKRSADAAAWFEDRLSEWAVLSRTEQRKSFPLSHGVVKTRKTGAAVVVDDHAALLAWARTECPDMIRVVEDVPLTALREHATIGQVIVGWDAVNTETGECERMPATDRTALSPEAVKAVQTNIGEPWLVTAITESAPFYKGAPIPGAAVRPERVTATASPYAPR